MLSSPAMTHVFIAPHPDDVALSCGGLVASLRELGQSVTILTVYSGGPRDGGELSDYQREALGFGTKTLWPNTPGLRSLATSRRVRGLRDRPGRCAVDGRSGRVAATQDRANTQARQFWQRAAWTRSANITNDEHDDRPLRDGVPTQGTLARYDLATLPTSRPGARPRTSAIAYFVEAAARRPRPARRGPSRLRGRGRAPRPAEPTPTTPPVEILRREILRLEPQQVYVPVGGGRPRRPSALPRCRPRAAGRGRGLGHARSRAGRAASPSTRTSRTRGGTSAPGPMPSPSRPSSCPPDSRLEARYADISDQLERKLGRLCASTRSQVERLFESDQGMLDAVTGFAARIAAGRCRGHRGRRALLGGRARLKLCQRHGRRPHIALRDDRAAVPSAHCPSRATPPTLAVMPTEPPRADRRP